MSPLHRNGYAPKPIATPEPYELVKRNDPVTSRIAAEGICADDHMKLTYFAWKALKSLSLMMPESATANETARVYLGITEREYIKYFYMLKRTEMATIEVRECKDTGCLAEAYTLTEKGWEYLRKHPRPPQYRPRGKRTIEAWNAYLYSGVIEEILED